MPAANRERLEHYLGLRYPFTVTADPEGYVITFPDLPGCLSQVDSLAEVSAAAAEASALWIETAYEQGLDIPPPSQPEEYSGKFNVRLPRSLHRALVEAADRAGMSLNQYVLYLLSRGDAQARLERRLEQLTQQVEGLTVGLRLAAGRAPSPRGRKVRVASQ
jgi:predicted RNase H-like HicB family nuclease